MTEELKVVLRRSEHSGFGFSLLGTTGPPHVIYDIVENSPAADCGSVEAGDVILKVNGTDVHRYTTKEVLKCLRLSDDLVTLELKRDPKLKARIKEQLANTKGPHYVEFESQNIYDYKRHQYTSPNHSNSNSTNSVNASGAATSPALRFKASPTHTASRQPATNTTPAIHSANHSRSSSNSSAKIQIAEANSAIPTGTGGTAVVTSPTCRPSRIPMKCPQKLPVQCSPNNKRPRPSQIPTKASPGQAPAPIPATSSNGTQLQHSNSYSGGSLRHHQQQQQQLEPRERDYTEPNSAPPQPAKAPRFEAYMMTGDLILNLSRTPQSSNLIPAHAKKVDSLRDSPIRAPFAARSNGGLAPRASGESSPTSSSSVESPTHTASSDSINLKKQPLKGKSKHRHHLEHQQQLLQQYQRDSINNSYNNSNSAGGGERQYRKDSLTNDTLLLCEELEKDDEDEADDIVEEEEYDDDQDFIVDNNSRQRQQQPQGQAYRRQQRHYEHYQNEAEDDDENEEDQTNYDITNIETYNSGGIDGGDEASDRQCLVMQYEDEDEEYSSALQAAASAEQRLRALRQKPAHKYRTQTGIRAGTGNDLVDCSRLHKHHHQHYITHGSASSSSSTTVKSDGIGGANTSQDETSFSVPTSPISLSTPLIDKETANSVPTSPEPSSLGAVGGGSGSGCAHDPSAGVVRRHNGVVRKCDSAGFRTSKSEDHLQQIQREGIAAVIPIDIDEDVNSSLNTLLDTRQDSEDSQQTSTSTTTKSTTNTAIQLKTKSPVPAPQVLGVLGQQPHRHINPKRQRKLRVMRPPPPRIPLDVPGMRTHNGSAAAGCSTPTTTNPTRDYLKASRDRIVWTYNAPVPLHMQHQYQQQQQQQHYSTQYGHNSSPNSHSSSLSSSPQHSAGSPASPTSVSSSVMSSSGSKGALGIGGSALAASSNGQQPQQLTQQQPSAGAGTTATTAMGLLQCPINGSLGVSGGGSVHVGDQSVSEAISNISSPDYQDDDNLLSSRDLLGGMVLSDPSDSDSTILVSDAAAQRQQRHQQQQQQQKQSEHKLVIQVKGLDTSNSASPRSAYSELKDSEDELATLTEEPPTTVLSAGPAGGDARDSSPPVSDDGSDVESLHSYHYSPKAVDMPSAIRLAKRLYSLDGFKKSDVSRHLSKNNDFSRAVADEYLKYFTFEKKTLDQSLREFLQQFSLSGETQERERVLVHFSKRFLDCNPGSFNSQDAVHTLTCAIMLLNTDLHGQNIGRKMTCAEFIENLAELNDGENFPKDILKYLYQAIKTQPLEWALDDETTDLQKQRNDNNAGTGAGSQVGQNPFLDLPESSTAVEYKKGYVMRKCCYDANFKKTPFGKRSWKMFYITLRDLVLYLHKDEHGFRKSQMSDNLHNAIRIHHALATKATDYTKKQHVFRLQTADQAEYLFQTSDSKELQSWVETINYVCAAFSAPPLEGGVGSQKRFQRPLLPSTHTKLLMKEQLEAHDQQLAQLENALLEHKKGPIPSKGLPLQNYREKENYLQYELRRYKAYASILSAKMFADQQQIEQLQVTNENEESDTFPVGGGLRLPQPQTPAPQLPPAVSVQPTQQAPQPPQTQSNSITGQQQSQQQAPANRWWLCGCCAGFFW